VRCSDGRPPNRRGLGVGVGVERAQVSRFKAGNRAFPAAKLLPLRQPLVELTGD
jgi:hypothetical protein